MVNCATIPPRSQADGGLGAWVWEVGGERTQVRHGDRSIWRENEERESHPRPTQNAGDPRTFPYPWRGQAVTENSIGVPARAHLDWNKGTQKARRDSPELGTRRRLWLNAQAAGGGR